MVRQILAGGTDVCTSAGIPVAGGHSIDSLEPNYGLAVIGICRPGDVLIRTKPLGVGIYSAAIRKGVLPPAAYDGMIATATRLNSVGTTLATGEPDVRALTDVTGCGLLGHALEVARGSKLALTIEAASVPLLPLTAELALAGHVTGASARNWASFGSEVSLPPAMPEWQRHVLCDPQTSGGLLVPVAPARARAVLATIRAVGFSSTAIIGHATAGTGGIIVV